MNDPNASKTQAMFRQLFLRTPWGVEVLNYLLSDLGFYGPTDPADAAAAALRNYALHLLELSGVDLTTDTLPLTRALTSAPPIKEETQEGIEV